MGSKGKKTSDTSFYGKYGIGEMIPKNLRFTKDTRMERKLPTVADAMAFIDACKRIKVSEYGLSIPYTGDLFTDSARPGETRLECKRRMHVEQQTMAIQGTIKQAKKITPRTKRERALFAQVGGDNYSRGYNAGVMDGLEQGKSTERRRSEDLLCRALAAATKGVAG